MANSITHPTEGGDPLLRFYKYAPWDAGINPYIRGNLQNALLFFASPDYFNDPFDVYPIIQYVQAPKKSSSPDPRVLTRDLRNSIGICCFSTHYDNLLMWSYYADRHKGICLCFEFPEQEPIVIPPAGSILQTPQVYPLPVTYTSQRPLITLTGDNNPNDAWEKALLTKFDQWKFENEYRALTIGYVGTARYEPSCLKAIIGGCRMNSKAFQELKSAASSLPSPPQVYRAHQSQDQFGLTFQPEQASF